jgi:UDP-2,3-diacylglucosamine hydrolase
MLYKYALGLLNTGLESDYFVFGHRHRPADIELKPGCRMVILGDWLTNFTYAEFNGKYLILKYFKNELL